jgi:hypothetical protein
MPKPGKWNVPPASAFLKAALSLTFAAQPESMSTSAPRGMRPWRRS